MARNRILISENTLDQSLNCKGLLFDTNIWLRVQGYFTNPRDRRSRTYSWFYKQALERRCQIFLPLTVLSEFVGVSLNAKAREAGWTRDQGKLHKFNGFNEWMSDISDDVHHVVSDCSLIDDRFSEMQIDPIFTAASDGGIDFNDLVISEICRSHELVLVTDDADMKGQDVDIVTANAALLEA
jgi:hypothetical protein